MSLPDARSPRLGALALALCALPLACGKGGGRSQSEMARWVDDPSSGTKKGDAIEFEQLKVKFETPDTLYVFRNCGEASHTPDGANDWIPIVTCDSTTEDVFDGEEEEDYFADDEAAEAGAEPIDLTFYVTKKTRPIDERAVTWFEAQFRQAGLEVSDISYQHEYNKKAGIYAKLHIIDGSTGEPEREIVQFMFPRQDVVFIAKMEYPFGETRSVEQDWQYIMWNFDFMSAPAAEG